MVNLITTDSYFNLFPVLIKELSKSGQDIDKRKFVFCEEKISLMVERMICSELNGSFNTDVYSFGNFLRTRRPMDKILTKESSSMAVKKILSESRLTCFRAGASTLASTLYNLFILLKSAKITESELLNAIDKTDGILKNKLIDIHTIFCAYEKFVSENGYEDQSSMLSYLPEIFNNSKEIEGAEIYIVGFSGFTRQIRDAIASLINKAKSVTAILTEGDSAMVYVNETAEFIRDCCKQNSVAMLCERVDSDYSEKGKYIANNLFNPAVKEFKEPSVVEDAKVESTVANNGWGGEVFYSAMENPVREIERIGQVIKRAVIQDGYRYKDFTIALPDTDAYATIIKRAFGELDIPYFLDQKKKPINHPLISLIITYMDAYRRRLERGAMIAFFKNPFVANDKAFLDRFENYVLKHNINYAKFNDAFTIEENGVDLNEFNAFREKFVSCFSKFDVEKMLEILNVKEKSEQFTITLRDIGEYEESSVNDQIYTAISKILLDMKMLLGTLNLTVVEYKQVFLSGVNALELSIIPQYSDAVFIGKYKETALAKAKFLFCPGLTSEVPGVHADVALLSDDDINLLENIKVMVEPKIKVINHRTRENVAMALSAFSERLYLSYPINGMDGKTAVKSEVLIEILSMFKKALPFPEEDGFITEKQGLKSFSLDCGKFITGEIEDFETPSAFSIAIGRDKTDYVLNSANKELKVMLDGEDDKKDVIIGGYVSPSAIESYHKCPYQNFMTRALRITEREDGEFKFNLIGTIMHEIFSLYAENIDKVTDKESSDLLFEEIREQVFLKDEYKAYLNDEDARSTIIKLIKDCKKFCYLAFKSINVSGFNINGAEAGIGDGAKDRFPSVKLLDGKVKLHGQIDRVDVSDKYFRVVDYKTGSSSFSEEELFVGKKLQLLLYSASVREKLKEDGKDVAGIYYMKVADEYGKNSDEKCYNIGKTLLDEDALAQQDQNIALSGKSQFVPVGKDDLVEKEELNAYIDYALAIAELSAKRMKEGVIVASPLGSTCTYCKFKGCCPNAGFNKRTVEDVSVETITCAIKGEQDAGAND